MSDGGVIMFFSLIVGIGCAIQWGIGVGVLAFMATMTCLAVIFALGSDKKS